MRLGEFSLQSKWMLQYGNDNVFCLDGHKRLYHWWLTDKPWAWIVSIIDLMAPTLVKSITLLSHNRFEGFEDRIRQVDVWLLWHEETWSSQRHHFRKEKEWIIHGQPARQIRERMLGLYADRVFWRDTSLGTRDSTTDNRQISPELGKWTLTPLAHVSEESREKRD